MHTPFATRMAACLAIALCLVPAGCVVDASNALTVAPADPAAAERAELAFVPMARPDPDAPAATLALAAAPANAAFVEPDPAAPPIADLDARLRPPGVAAPASRPGDAPASAEAPGVAAVPGETALVALAPPRAVFRAPGQDTDLDRLIARYAAEYGVPEALVRRVVKRESRYNPNAYNKGHWGLMQIKHATARGMGYLGPAKGLLDAETNLKYSVKYLRGAWLVAGGNHDRADRFYQTGYYYDAKRMGLLDETGLGRDRVRKRRPG